MDLPMMRAGNITPCPDLKSQKLFSFTTVSQEYRYPFTIIAKTGYLSRRTDFYFIEKHLEAIAALDISESIKEDFYKTRSVGRLIPMILADLRAEAMKK